MTNRTSIFRATQSRLRAMQLSLTGRTVRDKVFFLHVPKCGGTSLNVAMSNTFGSMAFRRGRCQTLHAVASRKAAEALGVDVYRYRESILLYGMAQNRARFIAGHYRFSDAAYQAFGDQWNFVTVLRNPVDRWFSLYFYVRHSGIDHYQTDLSIEAFLESERGTEAGCDYVKLLTDSSLPEPCSGEPAMDQALENLEKFAVVGLLEDLDQFERDFESKFGAPLRVQRLNPSPAASAKRDAEASPNLRGRVEELCGPNLRVFEAVQHRLADRG